MVGHCLCPLAVYVAKVNLVLWAGLGKHHEEAAL